MAVKTVLPGGSGGWAGSDSPLLAEIAFTQARRDTIGLNEVLASPALLDILFSTASVLAEIAGDTEFITAMAASDTAMQKIAANASVMAVLAQNSAAMTIFMASLTACTRLAASATAMAAIAARSEAMDALHLASSANKAKYANSTAWTYLVNSSYRKNAIITGSASSTVSTCVSNAMLLGYGGYHGSGTAAVTLTATVVTGAVPNGFSVSTSCASTTWSTPNLTSILAITLPITSITMSASIFYI
jgi:hypothetical protein